MLHRAVIHKLSYWTALFAILMATLAPTISHAVSAARGELWMEICTVEGTKFVKFGETTPESAPPLGKTSKLEHCSFCSSGTQDPAILPTHTLSVPVLEAPAAMPNLFYQSPRPLAIWLPAQSRAPPALS